MGSLQILTRDEAAFRIKDWPDVYYSPAYAAVVEVSDGAAWQVAVWKDGAIMMPYLLRPIPTDFVGSAKSTELFDIVSPYGYSGCFTSADVSEEECGAFRTTLRAELKRRGVVAEFLRLGSLVPGRETLLAADKSVTSKRHNDTIGIDTTVPEQVYWDRCEGRARTAVRKATRLGYSVTTRPIERDDLVADSPFRSLYSKTMQRVAAQSYYYFQDAYYETLYRELGAQLRWFLVSNASGEPVVIAMTMVWQPFVHLHLVGSDPMAMRDGAGNLCYDGMLRWACQQPEIQLCHLGGGLTADDALFNFKKSFGGERMSFWIASSILNAQAYEHLTRQRATAIGCTTDELLRCSYFPAYRAPERLFDKVLRPAA
jgi:hypothetical protein